MLTKKKITTSLLLIFGIIVLVNIISDRFYERLDFTADKEYTLSDATKSILDNLTEPVTVKAYFSENLPPNVEQVKKDFKDLLIEYNDYSDGNVVYDFTDPTKDQKTEMEAQQQGIQPVLINVRERDQMKQQKAYLGAVLEYGNKSEVIPFIQPGSAMEYDLSSNIKKLTLKNKTKVAFLQGNGEPTLSEMGQLNEQLSVMYDVSTVKFNDTSEISNQYKTLVIIAPTDTIEPKYISQLDDFLKGGGRILFALNRVKGDLSTARGTEVSTGLNDWLKKKGIDVQGEFVVDVNSGNVMVRQQNGMFVMNTPVKFPYLPVITKFADHPITKGIESVLFPFASPIKITNSDSSVHITTLAETSNKSGMEKPPVYFNVTRQWTRDDFPASSIPVAVAVDGKIVDNVNSKMVVFGDGDFAINGQGQNQQKLEDDNVNLMANAIDWLSDDTGLIGLRTKGVKSRPLNADIEQSTKTFVKYLNFLLPMILVIGFGLIRKQFRDKKRNKWITESYVQ
jgi:gliding motility-associatede transport system auxiliary component